MLSVWKKEDEEKNRDRERNSKRKKYIEMTA